MDTKANCLVDGDGLELLEETIAKGPSGDHGKDDAGESYRVEDPQDDRRGAATFRDGR